MRHALSNRHAPWVATLFAAMAGPALASGFTVHSDQFAANGRLANDQVYSGFGCSGHNVSPALSWSGAPSGTRSFALTVYDPDAPTGSGWWHWLVYNLPANTHALPLNAGAADGKSLPSGAVQGRTDFGTRGYGGPCPPAGDKPHHYVFTVYALKTDRLDLPADATAAMIGFNLNGNALAKASVTGLYGR